MGSVYLLIHISACNHPPFPPLETYENYDINLGSSNHSLTSVPVNLVDQVWKDRPPIPDGGIIYLPDRVIRGSPSANTHFIYLMGLIYTLINICTQPDVISPINTDK